MTRKLKYFHFNGLGEPIRYVLMHTGKQYEDDRVDLKTWPDQEFKASLPFGKMPVFEEDGKFLYQSLAIMRYVATGTELLPSDPWEQAVLDAAAHTCYEFLTNVALNYIFEMDPTRREEGRKKFYNEDLDYTFSRIEKQLKDNNGYFVEKLSWADLFLVGVIECINTFLKGNIEKNYPLICELIRKIHSLPRIKEYVSNREPYYPYHLDNFIKRFQNKELVD